MEFVYEEARPGIFVFTLYDAKKLRNVDPMGQQNPYVEFSLGNYVKKSDVVKKGGKDPYFAEKEVIMWVNKEIWVNNLKLKICDQELGPDNAIAYTEFCLLSYMDIRPSEAKEELFDLFYAEDKGAEVAQGQLRMKVQFLPAGQLTVKCQRAKNLLPQGVVQITESSDIRLDPYVSFALNSQAAIMVKKTPVDKDGGPDPVWEADIDFDVVDQYLLDIEVFNQNFTGEDDLIGTAQVSLLSVFKGGVINMWATLKQKKPTGGMRDCGDINLLLVFAGPPAIAYPQYRSEVDSFDDSLRKTMDDSTKQDLTKQNDSQSQLVTDILKGGKDLKVLPQEFTDDEILNAFKFIDLDKNNFIGAGEIRHILICMGELITDEEIDMMISMVDTDGDGQVSFKEFKNIVLHPNPAMMNVQDIINEEKMKELEEETAKMAGKANELDSATYQRQKEMQLRDSKKKMLVAFVGDHEFDFENLRSSYVLYVALPKEKRLKGQVSFEQFCSLLRVDPIGENLRLFGLFDEDRVGRVDMREFLLGAMNFVVVSREIRLPLTFQMYDEDKTGYINVNEIQQILKGNHMMSLASVYRKAQTVMKQASVNENNALTLKEFMVVSKKFPNIILPSFDTKAVD